MLTGVRTLFFEVYFSFSPKESTDLQINKHAAVVVVVVVNVASSNILQIQDVENCSFV